MLEYLSERLFRNWKTSVVILLFFAGLIYLGHTGRVPWESLQVWFVGGLLYLLRDDPRSPSEKEQDSIRLRKRFSGGAVLALLLLASSPTHAQTYELQAQFGIVHTSTKTLTGAGYTYAQAKAKYKQGIEWLEFLGATQAEVMSCDEVAIAHNTAVWLGDAYPIGGTVVNYTNGCQSRAHVIWPHGGNFRSNIPLLIAHGIVEGQGSSVWYDGSGTTGGTGITLDHGRWLTRLFPERLLMMSSTWGQGVEGQYAEGLTVRNFNLNGGRRMQAYDASYMSAGIAIAQAGSTSLVSQVISDAFNTAGIVVTGGIPLSIRDTRCFYSGLAGILCRGTALSTMYMDGVEFDDNGRGVLMDAGYGNAAGGTLVITGKSENGKNKLPGGVVRQMPIIEARGAFNITVTGWSAATYAGKTDYAFILDPQGFQASFSLRGFRHCGHPTSSEYSYLLRDAVRRWNMPSQCAPINVEWTGNGVITSSRPLSYSTADAPQPHDPFAPLYAVNFGAVGGARNIPGTAVPVGNAVGSISGGRLVTSSTTCYRFIAPVQGVGRIVLRGATIRDGKHRQVNDLVESFAGQFRHTDTGELLGVWRQFAEDDYEIVFRWPVSVSYLVGWGGRANTTPMSVAGIELYAMAFDPHAP